MTYEEANAKRPQIDAGVAEALAELAPDVVEIQYKIALDSTDEWSVFVRAVLSDEAAKDIRKLASRIFHTISDKIDLGTIGMFSYVDFRSQSDQAKSKEPAWV